MVAPLDRGFFANTRPPKNHGRTPCLLYITPTSFLYIYILLRLLGVRVSAADLARWEQHLAQQERERRV